MKKHRWIFWLLIAAFGVLVIHSFTDFRTLVATMLTGQWPWLLAALTIHLLYFLPYTAIYELAFAIVGVAGRWWELVPVVFAAVFANAVLPSGGASAVALFVSEAARRGQPGARAAVGTVLVLIADLATLVPFLLFGMGSLYLRHELKFYDVIGGVIFMLFVGGLCGSLVLAGFKPGWLRSLMRMAQRIVNRVGHWIRRPQFLADEWAIYNAGELTDAATAVRGHPGKLALALALGLLVHGISLASLYTVFQGYRQPVALGPLTAGFGMGIVFWVITVVPQGVGATEGIMTLVFMSFGVPRARALTIALVFRGVNFYLPLAIGFFCLRRLRVFGIGQEFPADTVE